MAGGTAVGAGEVWEVLLGLALVVLSIFAVAWLLRRVNGIGMRGNAVMRVLATLPVGQRERVLLVEIGDTQLLLGVTANGISRLHKFDDPVPLVGNGGVQGGDFALRLRQALLRGESG